MDIIKGVNVHGWGFVYADLSDCMPSRESEFPEGFPPSIIILSHYLGPQNFLLFLTTASSKLVCDLTRKSVLL